MRVSVVIPLYNGAAYVGDALESVFGQTLLPDEVIVVDDCSTDDSVSVVERLAAGAPVRVQVLRLERNSGGPARPINVGIEAARGDVVLVLDQDDVLLQEALARHVKALQRYPEAQLSFGLGAWHHDSGRLLQREDLVRELTENGRRGNEIQLIASGRMLRLFSQYGNFIWGFPAFAFWRDAVKSAGGVSRTYAIAADYDLLCRLANVGPMAFHPERLYLRRTHGENHSERSQLRTAIELYELNLMHLSDVVSPEMRRQWKRNLRTTAVRVAKQFRDQGRYREAVETHLRSALKYGISLLQLKEAGKLAVKGALHPWLPLHRWRPVDQKSL